MRVVGLLVLCVACGDHASAGDAAIPDAPPDAAMPDAACMLPVAPTTCDPSAMPLPNPSCLVEEPGTGGFPARLVRGAAFFIHPLPATVDCGSPLWDPRAPPPPGPPPRGAVPPARISCTPAPAS